MTASDPPASSTSPGILPRASRLALGSVGFACTLLSNVFAAVASAASPTMGDMERRLQLMLENASDIVLDVGPDDTYRWVSPSVQQVLGWEPKDLIGKSAVDIVHPDDFRVLHEARKNRPTDGPLSKEFRYLCADGTYRWLSGQSRLIFDDKGNVTGRVVGLRDAQAEREAREALLFMATHDALTGLLTRDELTRRLDSMLAHERRSESHLALLFLDLDWFKTVNDEHGHAVGDQVIIAAGKRIVEQVRVDDLVARFGGDEFIILLTDVRSAEASNLVASNLASAMAEPMVVNGITITIGASIGVSLVDPAVGGKETLERADQALYDSKQAGRGRSTLYKPGSD